MNFKVFSTEEDYWNFYSENGFVILRNLFSIKELNGVLQDLKRIFETGFNTKDEDFDKFLISSYSNDLSMWRACASRMWDSLQVNHLYSSTNVQVAVSKLKLSVPVFSTRPEVRIDMPNDNLYRQEDHQDFPYGQSSLNSVTMWTPLQDVSRINGTIQVIPGSHLEGLKETEVLLNPRRFKIKEEFSNDKFIDIEIPFGYTVIFSQFLVHRSGNNTSHRPRLSFQGRFADFSDKHFNSKKYLSPNKENIEIISAPSKADVKEFFSLNRLGL